jgi:hypothetical protein
LFLRLAVLCRAGVRYRRRGCKFVESPCDDRVEKRIKAKKANCSKRIEECEETKSKADVLCSKAKKRKHRLKSYDDEANMKWVKTKYGSAIGRIMLLGAGRGAVAGEEGGGRRDGG